MTEAEKTDSEAALIAAAQAHLRSGSLLRAMEAYYKAHELNPASVQTLAQLVAINLHLEAYDQAIVNLQKLIRLEPLVQVNYDQLAGVYDRVQEWDQAAEIYKPLIIGRPELAEAHFNHAYYLRRAGQFEEAIAGYKRAIKHGIKSPEEAHLNIAVILSDDLRREDDAEKALTQALELNDKYLPALYNLANLYEDRGDRDKTVSLFRRILALDPNNPKALARLAPLAADEADLVERLDAVSLSKEISISDRIDALHALGKIRDAQADYDRAFVYFEAANVLNATQMPPYDQEAVERYFDQIIESVSATWLETHRLNETAQPIFVCGMFRSGSTLADQILGSHPDITTGGERDSLVREFNSSRLRYPADLVDVEQATLSGIAGRYLARSKALFPEARLLTDKRPDNFLYLGAMKALFPKAKIIYTMRNPLDNCLSVYFERLGLAMNYAVSLDSTAHYYEQQVRLRNHWQSLFGADVHVVHYERLIKDPKSQVSEMLRFLGLEWHDDCLNFHALGNTVKTASVWQIRKPLYTTSVGRWRNYEAHLGALAERYADGTGDA